MSEEYVETEQDRLLKEMCSHLYLARSTVQLISSSLLVTLSWCEYDSSSQAQEVVKYLKSKEPQLDSALEFLKEEERRLFGLHEQEKLTKSMADGYAGELNDRELFDFEVKE